MDEDTNETPMSLRRKTDIAANRARREYGKRELAARLAWRLASPLFSLSPRPLHAWRRWLLKRFGAKIGANVHIYPSVRIQYPWLLEVGDFAAIGDGARIYNLGPLSIGARATVSQFVHLCGGSHDHRTPDMRLLKTPIVIGSDAWICADAFVGPGVSIGEGAVVGARAAVFKSVEPWTIVGGNPAVVIGVRQLQDAPSDASAISSKPREPE
jgi:putative colanic acid biosynthesis acetyltransferase WcaF